MMPLLNFDDLTRMFSLPAVTCHECGRETYQNYCRECDEFYQTGHASNCTLHGEHSGHRIYPTLPSAPFPTKPAEWAIYLDVMRQRHVWIEHAAIAAMFSETINTQAYADTFLDMGDRALAWTEKTPLAIRDGAVYKMHFDGSTLDLRIGMVGGQLMLFMPKPGIEG